MRCSSSRLSSVNRPPFPLFCLPPPSSPLVLYSSDAPPPILSFNFQPCLLVGEVEGVASEVIEEKETNNFLLVFSLFIYFFRVTRRAENRNTSLYLLFFFLLLSSLDSLLAFSYHPRNLSSFSRSHFRLSVTPVIILSLLAIHDDRYDASRGIYKVCTRHGECTACIRHAIVRT